MLILAVLLTWEQASYGRIILFDDRVDTQQITEVRYNVPAECVVTGLGFRAHYDNITTMHCRYHRLLSDGTLGEPQEVHLGSEPDHKCEGKVLLPDGWVAVGFGAAGEPEWDVTLVRVWARPLNTDGTLGEIKAFSDGFKPDRGTEREVLLSESDRAMTGVGLRFGFNDITGIYGCSQRIIAIDEKTSKLLQPFVVRGWVLDGVDVSRLNNLAKDMKTYKIGRLDICLGSGTKSLEDRDQVRPLKSLVKLAGANNVQTYLWVDVDDSDIIKRVFKQVQGLTGIVVEFERLPRGTSESKELKEIQSVCKKAKRKLCLRINPSNAAHCLTARGMPKNVSVIVPWTNTSGEYGDFAKLGRRDVIVEIDLVNQTSQKANLPDVQLNNLASQLVKSQLAGANDFMAHINTGDRYVTDTVNSLMLSALHRLADNPFQSTESLWDELCTAGYGAAGPQAKAALQHASAASDLIFGSFGLRFLWLDGRIASVNVTRNWLQMWLANIGQGAEAESIRKLLAPTDKVIREIELEKETALWFIRQSVSSAKKAAEINPSPQTHLLCVAAERLQQAGEFSKAITRAYMYTQLYAQDVAPKTRQAAEAMLENLPKLAKETSALMGDNTICQGLDEFIASARASLKESSQSAPLAAAFRRVRQLSNTGRDDDAAQALAGIFKNATFAAHLDKHNDTLGQIASSLDVFWKPNNNLRVVRGADGQWVLEKIGGRWCWATTEESPCIYFDVLTERLDRPADYLLSFEYFDEGDFKLWFNYDSDYPGGVSQRQYHPAEPWQLNDTKTWKEGSALLTKCIFGNGQNVNADMRFLGGRGKIIRIRNVRLTPK